MRLRLSYLATSNALVTSDRADGGDADRSGLVFVCVVAGAIALAVLAALAAIWWRRRRIQEGDEEGEHEAA
jgi:hypothetical protein